MLKLKRRLIFTESVRLLRLVDAFIKPIVYKPPQSFCGTRCAAQNNLYSYGVTAALGCYWRGLAAA